jgi:predicted nuclease of predicted toxin-antitoxin system
LRKYGHDVVHLRDENLQRLTDKDIIKKALSEGRVVLTMDLDFGYLVAVSNAKLPSIIIFRLKNESSKNVNRRLENVLAESLDAIKSGAVVTVLEHTHRVRHLPIEKNIK